MRSAPGQKYFDGRMACHWCGRTLIGAKSIERGYGPTCWKRVQKCRVCGCTHFTPCAEGCWWVEEDLCSACADPQETEAEATTMTLTKRTQRRKERR